MLNHRGVSHFLVAALLLAKAVEASTSGPKVPVTSPDPVYLAWLGAALVCCGLVGRKRRA